MTTEPLTTSDLARIESAQKAYDDAVARYNTQHEIDYPQAGWQARQSERLDAGERLERADANLTTIARTLLPSLVAALRHERAEIERLRSLTPSGTYSLDRNHEQERQRLVTERDEARACEAEAMRAREIMARMVAVYRARLEKLTACRCDAAWTTRGLHAPECHADEGWLDEPTAEEMP